MKVCRVFLGRFKLLFGEINYYLIACFPTRAVNPHSSEAGKHHSKIHPSSFNIQLSYITKALPANRPQITFNTTDRLIFQPHPQVEVARLSINISICDEFLPDDLTLAR